MDYTKKTNESKAEYQKPEVVIIDLDGERLLTSGDELPFNA